MDVRASDFSKLCQEKDDLCVTKWRSVPWSSTKDSPAFPSDNTRDYPLEAVSINDAALPRPDGVAALPLPWPVIIVIKYGLTENCVTFNCFLMLRSFQYCQRGKGWQDWSGYFGNHITPFSVIIKDWSLPGIMSSISSTTTSVPYEPKSISVITVYLSYCSVLYSTLRADYTGIQRRFVGMRKIENELSSEYCLNCVVIVVNESCGEGDYWIIAWWIWWVSWLRVMVVESNQWNEWLGKDVIKSNRCETWSLSQPLHTSLSFCASAEVDFLYFEG